MPAPIKTIETPVGKNKIEIKEWITGRDREYIDGSFLSNLEAKPRLNGQGKAMNVDLDKINMEKMSNESVHRAIEKFVVSVDGKKEKVVDLVFDLHEDDTAFILEEIDKASKKKGAAQTT